MSWPKPSRSVLDTRQFMVVKMFSFVSTVAICSALHVLAQRTYNT